MRNWKIRYTGGVKKVRCTRAGVWKHVSKIREQGWVILAVIDTETGDDLLL